VEILHESERPENTSTTAITTVDLASATSTISQSEQNISEGKEAGGLPRQKYVGIGIFRFRFNLAHFRLGRGL
jgi:hypothetical protein